MYSNVGLSYVYINKLYKTVKLMGLSKDNTNTGNDSLLYLARKYTTLYDIIS